MENALGWLPGWYEDPIVDHPVRVIGIDLGTTNSTVTEIVWDPTSDDAPIASLIDIPQLTSSGEIVRELLPSVVALKDGVEYVGEGAHRLRSAPGTNLVRNRDIWSETKNDIGTRRTYAAAPDGYRTPRDIAGRILRVLHEGAIDASERPIDKVVITVPASFQLTQRQDTLDAAESAGIEISGQDLFDEPVAAFMDYLVQSGGELLQAKERSRVMVVDFGGGTCDVALLEASRGSSGDIGLSRKGVSRFHRIGGSDIDAVIAHDVLLPQVIEQNGIEPFALSYKHKRDYVIPALSSLAEQLKKKLSDLANKKIQLGTFDRKDSSLSVSLPMPVSIDTGHPEIGTVSLTGPNLALGQMRVATRRFFSPNLLVPKTDEYFQAASIFAPIQDSLTRADWTPMHVDHILLVGGASLDFRVREALGKHFPDSSILTYKDPLDAQRCVGRGAAYQALLLAAFGRSPLVPTTGDAVSVRTTTGPHVVIPPSVPLPYPDDGAHTASPGTANLDGVIWSVVPGLSMSLGAESGHVDLHVEFLSGERSFHTQLCSVKAPVAQGTPITLLVRVDDNQRLRVRLEVETEDGVQSFVVDLDNPFSVTANPNADRDRILELEEQVLSANPRKARKALREMAQLHHGLREYERARHLLEGLLHSASGDETRILLVQLGRVCGDMGDVEAQIEFLQEAIRLGDRSSAAFSLAYGLRKDQPDVALPFAEQWIGWHDDGPGHGLLGVILSNLGREDDAVAAWSTAVTRMPDMGSLSDFELAWLHIVARRLGDNSLQEKVEHLRSDRETASDQSGHAPVDPDAALPDRNS